jgi:hypothetical protein
MTFAITVWVHGRIYSVFNEPTLRAAQARVAPPAASSASYAEISQAGHVLASYGDPSHVKSPASRP